MRLAEPGWLVFLAAVPLPYWWERTRPRLAWPTLGGFPPGSRRRGALLATLRPVLRGAALACLAVALARPQTVAGRSRVAGQGVTILVVLDHSPSMNTPDFPAEGGTGPIPRLEAARRTLARFIEGRPDDLIGLLVFARWPDLVCPPTLDHPFLLDAVRAVRPARAGDYGTDLGDAFVWALGTLREARTPRKVIVLLTDGRNNPARTSPPPADPVDAAGLAGDLGVTVHTIAVGKAGTTVTAVEPVTKLNVEVEADAPDFALLAALARAGGGRAFEASDARSLGEVLHTIDALETSHVRGEVRTRYREQYVRWVLAALGLVAVERWLAVGRLRTVP